MTDPRAFAIVIRHALLGVLATIALAGVAPPARADTASIMPGEGGVVPAAEADTIAADRSPPAPQTWAEQQSALCTAAIEAAEAKYHLPAKLLGSIAKVESGRPITAMRDVRAWPWTINADGAGLFLDSKAAAVVWARQALTRGVRYMDLGCMQVDWQLHPGAFASIEQAFDPVANADYAARYLTQLHAEAGGDWNVAVGLYHSHTPALAEDYRSRVAAVGAGIVSGIGGPEPLYLRAIRQGTLRLALAGGGVLRINLNRQPSAPTHRRMSACRVAAVLRPLLASPSRTRSCAVASR